MTGFRPAPDNQPLAAVFGGLVEWLVAPSMTALLSLNECHESHPSISNTAIVAEFGTQIMPNIHHWNSKAGHSKHRSSLVKARIKTGEANR